MWISVEYTAFCQFLRDRFFAIRRRHYDCCPQIAFLKPCVSPQSNKLANSASSCYNGDMPKAFKYRINPTKGQRGLLEQMLEECRWLYNQTLAYRKDAWQQEQRNADWYETKRRIPLLKTERPSLKNVHSQVSQNVTERVDLAFKAFFRRLKAGEREVGYPRFKGKRRYDSITYAWQKALQMRRGINLYSTR